MNKVYIVTSGYYSDYGINAVFSTRENAELYTNNNDYYEIEEWYIDVGVSEILSGKKLYEAECWVDSDEIELYTRDITNMASAIVSKSNKAWLSIIPDQRTYYKLPNNYTQANDIERANHMALYHHSVRNAPKAKYFSTVIWARSDEHAMKIAAERKAALLYEHETNGIEEMEF